MPSYSQIVPEHNYAHVMTVINDNSAKTTAAVTNVEQTYCNMMCVFSSPKGKDRELQSVSGLDQFKERFGIGTFAAYGQPYMNAYAAASTNAATLHCLRVTADDATYSLGALVAHYKVTPGTDTSGVPTEPESSSYVDLNGHDLIAMDETDDFDVTTVTIAGLDVEAGISSANQDLFGGNADLSHCVDVTLDLAKVMEFDPEKTYQITQKNPLLAKYAGIDDFVSEIDGVWTKVKTYSGADLATEGYALLIGNVVEVELQIVEWGEVEPADPITNNTDLGVACADDLAVINVDTAKSGNVSGASLILSGSIVAGVINSDLWGDVTGNNLEIDLTFPGLDATHNYRVVQVNDNLSKFAQDPTISQESDGWTKDKTYSGADLADGYGVLLGEGKGGATVMVYDVDADDALVYFVNMTNNGVFVSAHSSESNMGAIGDPVIEKIAGAVAFTDNDSLSVKLMAETTYTTVLNRITPAQDDDIDGQMDVFFTFEGSTEQVTDVTNLGNLVSVSTAPDADGYSAVKVFELAARGRGSWGDNVRFVIENYPRGDRQGAYKCYKMTIYEIDRATLVKKEEHIFSLEKRAVSANTGSALYADLVLGDPFNASDYVVIATNPTANGELFAAYKRAVPSTAVTQVRFDPLFGMAYGTSLTPLDGYSIDTTANGHISLSGASGVQLLNGSDGAFAEDAAGRDAALAAAYLKAYSGEIDRNVASKKLFPTDVFLDANFDTATKAAMHTLIANRKDCMGMFDLGTKFNTYAGLLESLADIEPYITLYAETIEAYRGKIQDPVSFEVVDVTSTYALAGMLPTHFQAHNGKHVPMAGSAYGVLSGFISGSAYPVYDEDLDQVILDELEANKVNFLKVNSRKQIVRGNQSTRQDIDTNLSEQSNVFILFDIVRDCVQLCELYEYNFSEAEDMARFNKQAAMLTANYADQVKSISGQFTMTDWERENGILHLYVDFIHKDIIKRSIVEVNVNRGRVDY